MEQVYFKRKGNLISRNGISLICKWNIAVFLFYVFWFKYAFRETVSIIYITGIIAIACMAVDILYNRLDVSSIFPFGVSVNLIMCLYSLITGILVAIDFSSLVSQLKTYICYTFMCMAVCYVTYNEKDSKWLANILTCVSIVCCLQTAVKGYHVIFYGYVMSADNNPNLFGLVLDLGIIGVIYTYPNKKVYGRAISISLIICFLIFIVGCGSRKCLIAGALITVMWGIPLIRKRIRNSSNINKGIIIIAVILLSAVIVYYYRNYYINTDSYSRMQLLGDTTNEEGSSAKRELFYKLAYQCFLESPFFGVGYQQFRFHNPYGAYSHSTYAEALASWGAIGCFLYFLPVINIGIKFLHRKNWKQNSYMVSILFALWVMELFLGLGQIWFYTVEHMTAWTLVFVCSASMPEQNRDSKREYKYVKD